MKILVVPIDNSRHAHAFDISTPEKEQKILTQIITELYQKGYTNDIGNDTSLEKLYEIIDDCDGPIHFQRGGLQNIEIEYNWEYDLFD